MTVTNGGHGLDIMGDVHGQLDALVALGRKLGYDVEDGWAHPDGRTLVFLGDLVDRGPNSLEVAKLVMDLAERGRAFCLLGNHEYNLLGLRHGFENPKGSNKQTVEDMERRPAEWRPVLDFFETLPVAVDLPALRLIHAVWHLESFNRVASVIGQEPKAVPEGASGSDWLRAHVVIGPPVRGDGRVQGLSEQKVSGVKDTAVEVLIKGNESPAPEPFRDNDGKDRNNIRTMWWLDGDDALGSKLTVFGHYWNLPPIAGLRSFTPPHPSGHPLLRDWQSKWASQVPPVGIVDVPADARAVCVDYNGVAVAKAGECVGAYRWPEHQVAWARIIPG